MGILYKLAVILIIFEGIIIQCEGNPVERDKMKAVLEKSIVIIPLTYQFGPMEIAVSDGTLYYRFGSGCNIVGVLHQYSKHVRKMYIELWFNKKGKEQNQSEEASEREKQHHLRVIRQSLKECSSNLEELYIYTDDDDEEFWHDVVENGISFKNVKKFSFKGSTSRKELNLKSFFPELESVELQGNIDGNCLAHVTTLKELELRTKSLQKHHLQSILENNSNLNQIGLSRHRTDEEVKNWAEKELSSTWTVYMAELITSEYLSISDGNEYWIYVRNPSESCISDKRFRTLHVRVPGSGV